jgi:hypothetical protein
MANLLAITSYLAVGAGYVKYNIAVFLVGGMNSAQTDSNEDGYIVGTELVAFVSGRIPQYRKIYEQNPEDERFPARSGNFIFGPIPPDLADSEFDAFLSAIEKGAKEAYQEFLNAFPNGQFEDHATGLLETLLSNSSAANLPDLFPTPTITPGPGDGRKQDTESLLVQKVQLALIQKNCLSGSADGQIGPMTREAIQRYKQTNESAINADRLRERDPSDILSKLSQSCASATSLVSVDCYFFNGSEICE